jgi:flagellar hook-associated protein 3 FlgL
MRVTNSMMLRSTLNDLGESLQRLQRSQVELSTGKQIRRPSDDPTGASSAMALRNQLRRAESMERAAGDAEAWLGVADQALTTSLETMSRAKELIVRGGNLGASNAGARSAIASELRSIREELLSTANVSFNGRSVFNGTASGPAYDSSGTYLGNEAAVLRDIAPGTTVQVNVSGTDVFGDGSAPEGDLFAVLDRMATAIDSGDPVAMEIEHDNFEAAATRLNGAVSQIGARASRLESIKARADANVDTLRETLSKLEDVDLAKAMLDVQTRQNSYQASLAAAARSLPPSLVDFMR